MSVEPAYVRTVSIHLSRTLDEIGLNALTVKKRRKAYLFREVAGRVFHRLAGKGKPYYHFGSQSEGTTTPGLRSDVDTLYVCHGYNVLQDWAEWGRGKKNLLMLQENTAPGYCNLQLLRSDVPMAREDLPSEHYTYDRSGRVLLKNTSLLPPIPGIANVRNGPARTDSDRPGCLDLDMVMAINCSFWPRQAAEFTRRHRMHGWPSQSLVGKAVKHGVFLVPVGYKLSTTEQIEWRISASLAERYLMFSLNIVHIKCYVVLKMFMKTFVEPCARNSISSYHCKTAVLYCAENTAPGFWRDENLLQCVINCLVKLLTWVTDGFCPQFIISEENLFAGKVNAQNRGILQSVLTDLIENNIHALLGVRFDDLGDKLQTKLNTDPPMPVSESLATVKLVGIFEYDRHAFISGSVTGTLVEYKSMKPSTVIRSVYKKIGMLKNCLGLADKQQRRLVQMLIGFLSSWLGSLLASFALSRGIRVPRETKQLFRIGVRYNVASMLKLASVYYCKGDFRKAEKLLQRLDDVFSRNDIHPVCQCYDRRYNIAVGFCHMMYVLRGTKKRDKLFAHCVRFSLQEIHCAPPALRNEMFRFVGDDIHNRDYPQDKWMILAVVDSLPYLYYIQCLVYRQLGKRDLWKRSLHNLDRCVREDTDYGHLETAWNLLGQCRELEQEPEAAMACYRKSLDIRQGNNAANWHLQNLCYKLIRDGALSM